MFVASRHPGECGAASGAADVEMEKQNLESGESNDEPLLPRKINGTRHTLGLECAGGTSTCPQGSSRGQETDGRRAGHQTPAAAEPGRVTEDSGPVRGAPEEEAEDKVTNTGQGPKGAQQQVEKRMRQHRNALLRPFNHG
ncbi:uncharacterized protein PG986_004258 [Apiospora aurea]|uniref:Uncharacterized protein n=1 Tax=Apiospora aurea TaxID=335848 RepID=A0ABR1QM31_9PEZI